jgi:TPR repeat protein
MSDYEWSNLDWEIDERVKHMTADELPVFEYKAKGGNVVAQTTLGRYWLAGLGKVTNSTNGHVSRNQGNNSKALAWLGMAVKAGFPIAQTELAELFYEGRGVDRNINESRKLFEAASKANYPRAKLGLLQVKLESGQSTNLEVMSTFNSMMGSMSTKNSKNY